jgi:nitroreductase
MTSINGRTAIHPVAPIFLERWSPRAFTGEAIPEAELLTILEAAHWAPSSYNSQPWRFIYALRGTPEWEPFLGLLNEFNRSWAQAAGAIVIVASKIAMAVPGKDVPVESYSHSFDAGAAWGYLALQASISGWAAHAMVGFDMPKTVEALGINADHRVEAAIAIGRKGDPSILPEGIRAREVPSPRNALETVVKMGKLA